MTPLERAPVSVIIPVHDRADLIVGALESVRQQVPRLPAEVIVVDDASQDESASLAEDMGAIVLRMSENSGPGMARDRGLAFASMPWCAFLDSDDEWAPNHLATLLGASETNSGLVVSSGVAMSAGRIRVTGNPYRKRKLLTSANELVVPESIVTTSACMISTKIALRVGGFGTLRLAEDLDLWLRMLDVAPGWALPEITVRYGPANPRTARRRASEDAQQMRSTAQSVVAEHSSLDAAAHRGMLAVAAWDTLRAAITRRASHDAALAVLQLAKPASFSPFARMLWHRHACRTRWRSQPNSIQQLLPNHTQDCSRRTIRARRFLPPLGRSRDRAKDATTGK